jgi:hypothetical protein
LLLVLVLALDLVVSDLVIALALYLALYLGQNQLDEQRALSLNSSHHLA